jgi:asparagine synthase (glutamine-hydrolysing)
MARVARLLDQHQSGERDHSAALWSLSMFEASLRQVHGCRTHAEAHPDTIESVV